MSSPSLATDPGRAAPPLLVVRSLSLRFGGVAALSDVSFDVFAGELLAVFGPNGAGKTSVLNCVNALHRPQDGSIRLDGTELVGRRPAEIARLGVARTFQDLGLFSRLDVVDNLLLGRHHLMRTGFAAGALWWGRARREEAEARAAVGRIVELLGLGPWRHRVVGTLPYGLRKRVELGRALAMEPKLLLLDEPVAGMGGEEADELGQHIAGARSELGLAVVMVEHDMGLVMGIAERVLVLDFGRVIAGGPPAAVQGDPRVVEAYLGRAYLGQAASQEPSP